MFSCCYSVSAESPIAQASLRQASLTQDSLKTTLRQPAIKMLGELPGPTPSPGPMPVLPLNKVDPPTPDLTPEEIAKIQDNLTNLQAFVKDCWIQQTDIITSVWAKLQSKMNQNKTSDDNSVKKFFEDYLAVVALVDTVAAFFFPALAPAFAVAAVLAGTISALLATNGSEVKKVMGGEDISNMASTHFAINDAWHHNMNKTFDYLKDNTNACRDFIFTKSNLKQTATLRSFIDHAFPASGTCYDNWLVLCFRMFKKNLVLTELAKSNNQFLDLYFIQDTANNSNVEFGHVYQPCAVPFGYNSGRGVERQRPLTIGGVGINNPIWANDEVRHYRKDAEDVVIRGTSNDDLTGSWLKATSDFVAKIPSVYIFPWSIDKDNVYTQKYFLIEGFKKMRDDQNSPDYNLGDPDFLNWLFIDDGVGNITNPEGVAFRYEVFRSKNYGFGDDVFLHAQQITNDIIDAPGKKWNTTCMDYVYGPADSKETNEKFHVYTGDLLYKNLPNIS